MHSTELTSHFRVTRSWATRYLPTTIQVILGIMTFSIFAFGAPSLRETPQLDSPSLSATNEGQRDYIKASEAKLNNWDRIVQEMRQDARTLPMGDERFRLERKADDLDVRAAALRIHVDQLKTNPSDWNLRQERVEAEFRAMERSYVGALAD